MCIPPHRGGRWNPEVDEPQHAYLASSSRNTRPAMFFTRPSRYGRPGDPLRARCCGCANPWVDDDLCAYCGRFTKAAIDATWALHGAKTRANPPRPKRVGQNGAERQIPDLGWVGALRDLGLVAA